MRQIVRLTAGKVLRSDLLIADEKEVAARILRDNPHFGNPHVVLCSWCHETRTLFGDESDGPWTFWTTYEDLAPSAPPPPVPEVVDAW